MGNVLNGNMLYSAILATGRAFFLGCIGIYFFRKGFLPPDTQRHISKMNYQVLIPALMFTSIVNSATSQTADDVSRIDFAMLLIFPIIWTGLGMLSFWTASKLFGLDKLPFRYSLLAVSSMANSLGLPLVYSSVVCEGNNSISVLFASREVCLTSLEAYLGKYNIIGGNVILYAIGKVLLEKDKRIYAEEQAKQQHPTVADENAAAVAAAAEAQHDDQNTSQQNLTPVEVLGREDEIVIVKKSVLKHPVVEKVIAGVRNVLTPPVISIMVALFFSGIKPINKFIFQSQFQFITVFMNTLDNLAQATIPLMLFVLGSDLSEGPKKGQLSQRQIQCSIISKLVITPACAFLLIAFIRFKTELLDNDSKPLLFILLLVSSTPPAISFNLLSQINGFAQKETSAVLFWQYIISLGSTTIWISLFLTWLA